MTTRVTVEPAGHKVRATAQFPATGNETVTDIDPGTDVHAFYLTDGMKLVLEEITPDSAEPVEAAMEPQPEAAVA